MNCSIRNVTAEVGAAVLHAAVAEGLAEGHGGVGPKELEQMSKVWKVSYYSLNDTLHILVERTAIVCILSG